MPATRTRSSSKRTSGSRPLEALGRALRALDAPWPEVARALAAASAAARGLPSEPCQLALPDLDLRDPGLLGRAYLAWHLPGIIGAAPKAREAGTKLEGEAMLAATRLYSEPYMGTFLARHMAGGSVVDPACGAGALLLAALEAGATHLAGCDLDPDAVALARIGLQQRALELGREVTIALEVGDGLVAFAGRQFDAVLANPPYLGRKLMSRELSKKLQGGDLFAAFLARALELVKPGGTLGFVTMKAWLYQASFQALRERYFRELTLEAFADLGSEAFLPELDLHEGVSVALTCWRMGVPADGHVARGVNATKLKGPLAKAARLEDAGAWVSCKQAELLALPGAPFCYDVPPALRELLARPGELVGCVKQGLATTDNQRFLRYAWEVPPGPRWVPCARGGTYRKWAGLDYERVDWEDDGARIKALIPQKYPYLGGWRWVAKNAEWYFQPGLTYGYMAYGALGARELTGAVFEVASIGVFPQARALDRDVVFAALNARTASWILRARSQKHMFQAGMAETLPLPRFKDVEVVRELVSYCVAAKRRLLRSDPREGACDPAVWDEPVDVALRRAAREAAWLHAAEGALEALVCEGYGLDEEGRRQLVLETGTPAGWLPLEHVPDAPPDVPEAVLHFLKRLPGPYPAPTGAPIPTETVIEAQALARGVHPLALIDEPPTEDARLAWIEDGLMVRVLRAIGEAVWLEGEPRPELGTDLHPRPHEWLLERFFAHHVARFKRRPCVWHLAGKGFVHAHHVHKLIDYHPDPHDGVRVNIAPLQLAGLLSRPVLTAADARKAVNPA